MATKKTKARTDIPYVKAYNTICSCFSLPIEEGIEPDMEMVALQAESLSPFEEGTYACGYERIYQSPTEVAYLAVIALEDRLQEAPWYESLKRRGQLGRCRIDSSVLGWLKALPKIEPALTTASAIVVLRLRSEVLFLALREGVLVTLHAVNSEDVLENNLEFMRECFRFMAQTDTLGVTPEVAYLFAHNAQQIEVTRALFVENDLVEQLHTHIISENQAETLLQQGLNERAEAKATMDLTLERWREEAKRAQMRTVITIISGIAVLIWLCIAGVLFFLPRYYEQQADVASRQYKALQSAYGEYTMLSRRVSLIERYQDRSNSALELLRIVCHAKPEGVTFLSFNFQQKNFIKISANATATADVYAFKEKLEAALAVDPNQPTARPPATVSIGRFVQDRKTNLQRVDVEIKFEIEEEEE